MTTATTPAKGPHAWGTLREPRMGVMLHYDASGSDLGAVAWLRDPAVDVSYNWLVLDNGDLIEIAPQDARAWHAGVCAPSSPALFYTDANSAFYGVAIAAKPGDVVTYEQLDTVVGLCRVLFGEHGWPLTEVHRIVGHDTEAVFPTGHPKAGQRGRKIDPTGPDPVHPVLSVAHVRELVRP